VLAERNEYERHLRRLVVLTAAGCGYGRAATAIHQRLEQLWNHLTEPEREAMHRLEKELNGGGKAAAG
jgi:hypothetical protein